MKCEAWVLWKTVGKKKPRKKASIIISMFNHYVRGFPLTDALYKGHKSRYKEEDLEKCDGEVVATVKAVNEPDWGGYFAKLEIEYKCKKCGNQDFEELPSDEETLSSFLTGFIAGMTEIQRFDKLTRKKEEKEAYDANVQKMMRETEERRKKKAKKKSKKVKK